MKKQKKRQQEAGRRTATSAEVVEVFDIDASTLTRWVSDGCPCDKGRNAREGNKFDLAEVAKWKQKAGLTGDVGRPREKTTEDLAKIRERKELALCRRYELEVAEAEGLVIAVAEVKARWGKIGNVLRSHLQNLSATILPVALRHGMPNTSAVKFQGEVQGAIDAVLASMAKEGKVVADETE